MVPDRQMSMRIRAAALGLLVLAMTQVIVATPAGACSCIGVTDDEAFDAAEVVLVGELVDYAAPKLMGSSADPALWTFEVERVFKGEAAREQVVSSPVSGSSCGLEIEHSGTFLVFAGTEPMFDGHDDQSVLHANLCGGTRPVTDGAVPASFGLGAPPIGSDGQDEAQTAEAGAAFGAGASEEDSTGVVLPVVGSAAIIVLGAGAALRWRRRI